MPKNLQILPTGNRSRLVKLLLVPTIRLIAIFSFASGLSGQDTKPDSDLESAFQVPFRLEAGGQAIDIGKLSNYAHAGPCLGDIDGDGDRDLIVGDFPGNFWLFQNTRDDRMPLFESRGKLQAGGEDAKTPVY